MKRSSGFRKAPSYVPLLLVLLLVGLYALRPLVVDHPNYSWMSTHYLVNYQEFGFIKRGLIGTLLTGLGIPVTRWTLVFLGTGFVFGVFAMAIVFFRWATQEVGRHTPFVRNLAILCTLSPATFMHFGNDLCRFEAINVILLMGAIMIVSRGRGWYAGALAVIGMLIHEDFILAGYPVLLLVGLTHRERGRAPHAGELSSTQKADSREKGVGGGRRRAPVPARLHRGESRVSRWPRLNWSLLPGLLTFPLVAILFIAFFGTYEGNVERLSVKFQTQGHFSSSTDWAAIKRKKDEIAKIWTRSVTDNIRYSLGYHVLGFHPTGEKLTTRERRLVVTDWVILLVVMWFYMRVFIKAFGLNWLTLSPLSVIPLFLLGTDWYRWGALAVTNMFIVSLVMIKRGVAVHDPEFASPRRLYWGKRLWLLGPFEDMRTVGRLKVVDAFEFLQRYFAG